MDHDPFSTAPDPRTVHPAAPPVASPVASQVDGASGRRRVRRYAALGVTAGLLGGGAIGAALGAPGLSAASGSGSNVATLVQQDDVEPADEPGTTVDGDDGCDGGGRGPFGGRSGRLGAAFDGEVVAELLDIDVATLREQLRSGRSLAEIAEDHGIDVQVVIDALVAEASDHLDLAVENGRLTQDEAAERLAEIAERVAERVEMVPGEAGGWMGRGPMGHGEMGRGGPLEVPSQD